jgi:hypothetical protein
MRQFQDIANSGRSHGIDAIGEADRRWDQTHSAEDDMLVMSPENRPARIEDRSAWTAADFPSAESYRRP